ncbi:hypothetical protein M758_UG255400 [Ceratodon purpureus]|nr:hypothetical protein M758_UG255400 [Ceratodon purpureus]
MVAEVLLNFQTYLAGSAWLKSTRSLYIHTLHLHMQYVDPSCSGECAKNHRGSAGGRDGSWHPGRPLAQSQPDGTADKSANAPDIRKQHSEAAIRKSHISVSSYLVVKNSYRCSPHKHKH